MEFNIKIHDIVIKIEHNYNAVRRLCADYTVDSSQIADFTVSVSPDAISREKLVGDNACTDAICEATCIHREITKRLVKYGIILIHSAAVSVDGVGYVFLAKSGVGKSTHINLWCEQFGDRATVINGDKPYFSFVDGEFTVHGSPFRGKEGWGAPISVPVGGICFLERGEDNLIVQASADDIIGRLFHQVLIPQQSDELAVFMNVLNRAVDSVPFFKMQCNTHAEAALVAFEGMRKELPI